MAQKFWLSKFGSLAPDHVLFSECARRDRRSSGLQWTGPEPSGRETRRRTPGEAGKARARPDPDRRRTINARRPVNGRRAKAHAGVGVAIGDHARGTADANGGIVRIVDEARAARRTIRRARRRLALRRPGDPDAGRGVVIGDHAASTMHAGGGMSGVANETRPARRTIDRRPSR